jgi:hypothetical protein
MEYKAFPPSGNYKKKRKLISGGETRAKFQPSQHQLFYFFFSTPIWQPLP